MKLRVTMQRDSETVIAVCRLLPMATLRGVRSHTSLASVYSIFTFLSDDSISTDVQRAICALPRVLKLQTLG